MPQWTGSSLPQLMAWHNFGAINTLRLRQNSQHFADDIFKHIFVNKNVWISIKISLKFVPKGPTNNIPALVQIMAWHRPDDKSLSEPSQGWLVCQCIYGSFSINELTCHAITWFNTDLLSFGPLLTHFKEIHIRIHALSFMKMPLKCYLQNVGQFFILPQCIRSIWSVTRQCLWVTNISNCRSIKHYWFWIFLIQLIATSVRSDCGESVMRQYM